MEITIKNLFYDTAITLSEESFSMVLESVDWGVATGSMSESTDLNGFGSKVTNTMFETRDIEIIGWLVAQDESETTMQALKNPLRRLINPLHDIELICNQYKIKVRAQNSVRFSVDYIENNYILCKFVLDFTAFYPFFTYENPEVVTDSRAVGGLIFPLVIDKATEGTIFGYVPENNISYIVNEGDISSGFLMVIEAAYGDARNLVITNQDTNKTITLNIELVETDILNISTVTGSKYVTLTHEGKTTDITHLVERGSEFWQLQAGENHIDIQAENKSNLEFTIRRSPSFLEVLT